MTLFFTKNLYFRTKNSFMTHFFTQFVLSHASYNISKYWGDGSMHGQTPTSNFWETVPQSPLKSPPMPIAEVRQY